MIERWKRGFVIIVAAALVATMGGFSGNTSLSAFASVLANDGAIYTGTCGENISWTFYSKTGQLEIDGSGYMENNPSFVKYNEQIKSVTIGDGIKSIGDWAFHETGITEIKLPKELEKIGDWAFWGCESIREISLPVTLSSIGEVAFEKCSSLEQVSVAEESQHFSSMDGVLYSKDMKELILYPASKMGDSFTIPGSVVSTSLYAFDYNKNLKELNIPSGVETLGGEKPFTGAFSLTDICVDGANPKYVSIDGNLYSKDGKKLIKYAIGKAESDFVIPDGVTEIEARAFQNSSNLKNITIPDSVISIGADAFEKSVEISAYEGSAAYEYAMKNGNSMKVLVSKKIASIEIEQKPKKLKFAVGENYNSVGMIVKINYTDGSFGLRNSGFDVVGFDSTKIGTCTVTVKFGDFTANYYVEIVEKVENEEVVPGETATVDIVESGQVYYMNFTPEKTGEYTFSANSGSDTYIIVYDETGAVLAENDDAEESIDFKLTYRFEAGVTYVIAVAYSDEEQIGSFTVDVKYDEEETTSSPIDEPDKETTTAKEPSSEISTPTICPTWHYEEKTTAPVKIPKTKVKSATKKKSAKSVKISLKKVKGAKKYQVQIAASKKFKKVLAKKTVKKVKFTVKNKKLKNKKKLYVRARAYVTMNKKQRTGGWCKPKKIKIKK